ncbi:MAG: hypothetical protein KDJ52_04545 [Anaerolineae bacterium]|nr:hypothetical protein [Anaerolineae bacterium]
MSEKPYTSDHEILPEDILTKQPSLHLTINKKDAVELDPALAEQLESYTSRERQQYLDQQVETLYEQVIKELNHFPADVSLALKKLNKAHGLVLEKPEQYNAALNEVAEVKMMIIEKRMRRQWAYTWGLMVFFYAVIWFVILAMGFFVDLKRLSEGLIYIAEGYTTIWYVALAGGLGGVVAVLYDLSEDMSKNQFERQKVMLYLIHPVTGLILGVLMFFVANTGFLVFGNATLGVESRNFSSPQILLIVLAWLAGFRQLDIYQLIDQILARVLPK